ncbi:hypothetical protein O3M35_003383 [Rhynocoris fuscipes]|uniref:Uncharacterized protein n=1 Tax=Rhynocoris fuscipes TaxID=488301 RepID=A0AAW1CJY5_9HEMI
MWLKVLFLLSLVAISWSFPLISDENSKNDKNGLIQGNSIPEEHELKPVPHSFERFGLLPDQILPVEPNATEDETINLKKVVKKPKAKPKAKPKPKAHPKKPSKKKPSKPKKKSHNSLTGSVTWKHNGLTVHGKKDKHGWGINIGKHH